MDKLESFIKRAREIHGNKYDYSLVDYKNNKTKVTVICPDHGEFLIAPSTHLHCEVGCRKCSLEKRANKLRMSTEEFIEKSKSIYGDRYDYSQSEYISGNTPIKMFDKKYNKLVNPKPYNHLQPKFKKTDKTISRERKTTESFIQDAKLVHGNKYDYSLVDYKDNRTKVKIICPEHGIFEQNRKSHITKGNGCPKCAIKNKGYKRRIPEEDFLTQFKKIHNDKYEYTIPKDGLTYTSMIEITCPVHGKFSQLVMNHMAGKGCSKCANRFSTQHELIKSYLIKNNISFFENTFEYIKPLELDFYLPDHKIGIEINGIYWHSELQGKDKRYHLNKTKLCEEKGIKLLHINENEFINSEKIILSKLNSILGINKKRIHGRKCVVKEIDTKTKSKFLDKYHLQGNDKASVKLGLFYNNHLVSIMTFCKRRVAMGKKSSEEGEYELSRYCGNFHFYTLGGASKLLKYFERNYNPSKIVTYADKRWSVGNLYYQLGFGHSHDSAPNYWYFKRSYKLYHRFNFRKSELSKKLETFDSNKTEWENMKSNDWNRIWDCGNMVFEKII